MPKCGFNKVAKNMCTIFVHQNRCSHCIFSDIFSQNTYGEFLLGFDDLLFLKCMKILNHARV